MIVVKVITNIIILLNVLLSIYYLYLHLEPLDIDLRNLGIALRNGVPTIVILDSGLNDEVCAKYY